MSIEIDIQTGDHSWPLVQSLFEKVWTPDTAAMIDGIPVEWAHPDLRVMIEAENEGVVCHVGLFHRIGTWKGRRIRIGGIGGVTTHPDHRTRGYAGVALTAAIQTLREERMADFLLLVCRPHHFAFYEKRGWHPFGGAVYAEQKGQRILFDTMSPYVFDILYGPRDGEIDLCGLPW